MIVTSTRKKGVILSLQEKNWKKESAAPALLNSSPVAAVAENNKTVPFKNPQSQKLINCEKLTK